MHLSYPAKRLHTVKVLCLTANHKTVTMHINLELNF